MDKPTFICLTAMKNEAWILDRFLSCTSLWADHIVLLNQNSEDNSAEIASKYEKVILKQNLDKEFNDYNHWHILMEESRKIKAERKVIIAIDCDEFLSSNTFKSNEWKDFATNALPGSLFVCNRVMISPDFDSYAKEPDFLIGLIDDGFSSISQLDTKKHVHNIRLPYPNNNPTLYKANKIKLLHYNVVDYKRFISKMRWYQCFEITLKDKSLFAIINQYYINSNFTEFWKNKKTFPIDTAWFEEYESRGIDMTTVHSNSDIYWWDYKIIDYFKNYGTKPFAKLPIWEFDWLRFGKSSKSEIKVNRTITDKIYTRLVKFSFKTDSYLLKKTITTFLKLS